jgi:hypothetical protein
MIQVFIDGETNNDNCSSRFLPLPGPVVFSVHMQYGQLQCSSAPNSLNGLPETYVGYTVAQLAEALRCKSEEQPPILSVVHCFKEVYCHVARN